MKEFIDVLKYFKWESELILVGSMFVNWLKEIFKDDNFVRFSSVMGKLLFRVLLLKFKLVNWFRLLKKRWDFFNKFVVKEVEWGKMRKFYYGRWDFIIKIIMIKVESGKKRKFFNWKWNFIIKIVIREVKSGEMWKGFS